MATYKIEPTRETLHGTWSREFPPVVTVDPGDTVRFRTLDADWVVQPPEPLFGRAWRLDDMGARFEPRDAERDEGHALCGPVAVRGAQPGMMLAVHINRIVPGSYGWAYPWFGTAYEDREVIPLMLWGLDAAAMTGRDKDGRTVALRPFMGVMGLAPDEPGIHPTKPPRPVGGNLDCKELVAGSTLYLPVAVPGALFSVGDGHALQGDGEVSGTAIECPMEIVDLTFNLVERPVIPTIHASTPAGWLTFGFDRDLQKAADAALDAMLGLLMARCGATRLEALGLAGVTVDLRVTQIVNDVRGAHALLPHGALR